MAYLYIASEIDDFTQSWTYAADSIDFVHGRYLLGSVGDWIALAKDAYRCLKPGGYFESYEASPFIGSEDGSVKDTSAMGQWGKLFVEGGKKLGQPFTIVPDGTQKKALEEAGFVDIHEWDFNVSVYLRLRISAGPHAYCLVCYYRLRLASGQRTRS